jgi:hypothetical protein
MAAGIDSDNSFSQNFDYFVSKDDPDYHLEIFWLDFKQTYSNFYRKYSKPYSIISEWSTNLNTLKKYKDYSEIERYIRLYMGLYAIDLIKFGDSYDINLFFSRLKEFNRIARTYNFDYDPADQTEPKKYYNLIFCLIDIFNHFVDKIKDNSLPTLAAFFSNIDFILENKDISPLIQISINLNLPVILDKLLLYDNIIPIINNLYDSKFKEKSAGVGSSKPFKLPSSIKGKKIISMIQKLDKLD